MDSRIWISVLVVASALVCGCEKKVEAPRPGPVFGNGTIRGVVKFIGTPPPRAKIANQPCHEGAPELLDETVVVNENGTLANVMVYLEGVPASDGGEITAALLDQKDCRYTPHVVGVQVGQTLRIRSSDPTMHNVHYNATENTPANFALTTAGSERDVKFGAAEFIRVKCDVHPWMTAYIGVFDHPFFAASGEPGGAWNIEKVPAGRYTLVAWHEQYGELRQAVDVKENESVEATFEYKSPN